MGNIANGAQPIDDARLEHDPVEDATTKVNRVLLLDRDELAEVSRIRGGLTAATIAFDLGVICVATVLSELYWSPIAYVLVVMVIGGRQLGLGSMCIHDAGVHLRAFKSRRVSAVVAKIAVALLFFPALGVTARGFRKSHLAHHRFSNLPDDPDPFLLPKKRWAIIAILLASLSGIIWLLAFLHCLLRGDGYRRVIAGVACSVGAWGLFGDFYPAKLFAIYWLIPRITWAAAADVVRLWAEHYPADKYGRDSAFPPVFRTRDVLPSWFDVLFVTPRGLNYHLTHHVFPSVPFHSIRAAQAKLTTKEEYRRYAHVTHGYHRVLAEVLFGQDDPEVGRFRTSAGLSPGMPPVQERPPAA